METTSSLPHQAQRRSPRHALHSWADIRLGDHDFKCLVADIGLGGLRLEEVVAAVGERVFVCLTLPQPDGQGSFIRLEGTVRWSTGRSAGICFDEPNDIDVFASVYAAVTALH